MFLSSKPLPCIVKMVNLDDDETYRVIDIQTCLYIYNSICLIIIQIYHYYNAGQWFGAQKHQNLPLLQCRAMVWSSTTSTFTIITMQGNGLELLQIIICQYLYIFDRQLVLSWAPEFHKKKHGPEIQFPFLKSIKKKTLSCLRATRDTFRWFFDISRYTDREIQTSLDIHQI